MYKFWIYLCSASVCSITVKHFMDKTHVNNINPYNIIELRLIALPFCVIMLYSLVESLINIPDLIKFLIGTK